jgi:hypothetical protein
VRAIPAYALQQRKRIRFRIAFYPKNLSKRSDLGRSALFSSLLYDAVSSTEVTYHEQNLNDYESNENN